MKTFYTAEQVADLLHVSIHTVTAWMKKGKIHYHKVGRLNRFTEEDIEDFLRMNEERA